MKSESSKAMSGIIFATTGSEYNILARRAARTLRQSMPDIEIDWYTDHQGIEDSIFNKIYSLSDSFSRPKMEAMRRSRFDRTLYLDADIIVLADVSELFEALDRFDLLGALAQKGAGNDFGGSEPPRCVAPINSGVLAIRKSEAVNKMLEDWEAEVRASQRGRDQPALRRVLFNSRLRYLVIGQEYNMMKHTLIEDWGQRLGAPRIIHAPKLHEGKAGDPETTFTLDEALPRNLVIHVRKLLRADPSVGGKPKKYIHTPRQLMRRQIRELEAVRERLNDYFRGSSPNLKDANIEEQIEELISYDEESR